MFSFIVFDSVVIIVLNWAFLCVCVLVFVSISLLKSFISWRKSLVGSFGFELLNLPVPYKDYLTLFYFPCLFPCIETLG